MIRVLVIFVAVFLFYMEPVFGLLSPVSIGPVSYTHLTLPTNREV